MKEDKNFERRNALKAELSNLMSSLSANTSPIGDWKVVKIYEARMSGKADPYDFEELAAQRQVARDRINAIQTKLAGLNEE